MNGLNGNIVDVETDISNGLPVFNIVGLPDTSIKEAKERVRSAIKNSGFNFPLNRITINLSPANLKKEGSQIDLSIAIGILVAVGVIKEFNYEDICFIGELSLDGIIRKINGALPIIINLKEKGINKIIIPFENKDECCVFNDIEIIPLKNLKELVSYLNEEIDIKAYKKNYNNYFLKRSDYKEDFCDIKGQLMLKRALEVAAAGGHNVLMVGPPGSGKTMISRRLPTILPNITFEESLEVTKVLSICGLLNEGKLVSKRPFRTPHHTTTKNSMIGGGRIPKPGEVSLAHYGVLFLDELPEFSREVLEVLRQPLEDGEVTISRLNGTVTYPSKFMMICSMNPCPCGHLGNPNHECTCSSNSINRYINKISGPLLDRIDIQVEVFPVKFEELSQINISSETSKNIRSRVNIARKVQYNRYEGTSFYTNSELNGKSIERYCKITLEGKDLMKNAFEKFSLSARGYNKVLKLSRTIADLDGKEYIECKHLAEAIQYRSIESMIKL